MMQAIVASVISALASEKMSRLMTKPTKWHVRPVKTQISLGIFVTAID